MSAGLSGSGEDVNCPIVTVAPAAIVPVDVPTSIRDVAGQASASTQQVGDTNVDVADQSSSSHPGTRATVEVGGNSGGPPTPSIHTVVSKSVSAGSRVVAPDAGPAVDEVTSTSASARVDELVPQHPSGQTGGAETDAPNGDVIEKVVH